MAFTPEVPQHPEHEEDRQKHCRADDYSAIREMQGLV
jgi:hypothetical protein